MTLRDQPYGHFTGARIEVPVDPLLRLQGYRDMARIRPRVRAIATKMAALAGTLVAPETYYRRVRIGSCTPAALALETGTETGVTFHSAEFAKVLGRCREVVVFVLTLGAGFDAQAERFTANEEIVEALFMEMAGWIAVERVTKNFAGHLASLVRDENLAPTRRLGPGYVDWPLEEQAALFTLLDGAPLPVRLLDSCAMIPKKSRSGLYGLRPLD
ncbi:MAG: hypothetical protein IH805_07345 [Proteobacteria bacterium]|nr:hypothetical protein [Pseudomonadota bacterium]